MDLDAVVTCVYSRLLHRILATGRWQDGEGDNGMDGPFISPVVLFFACLLFSSSS